MDTFNQQGQFKTYNTPEYWDGSSFYGSLIWYSCFDDKDCYEDNWSAWTGDLDAFGNQTLDKRGNAGLFSNFGGNSITFTTEQFNSSGVRYVDFSGNAAGGWNANNGAASKMGFSFLEFNGYAWTTFTNFIFIRYLNSTSSRWEMFTSNVNGYSMGGNSFNMRLENNKVVLYQASTPRHTWTSTNFTVGNDYKIIYTVNGQVITLYVNGTNMGSYTMGWNYGNYIGMGFQVGDKDGQSFDNTMIKGGFSQGIYKLGSFTKVLSSSEISTLNSMPLGAFP